MAGRDSGPGQALSLEQQVDRITEIFARVLSYDMRWDHGSMVEAMRYWRDRALKAEAHEPAPR